MTAIGLPHNSQTSSDNDRFLLCHLAILAHLFDVFAFGITGAAQELAVTAAFDGHRFAAQFANFIGCRRFLRDDFTVFIFRGIHGIFAFRITRTGQKLSETPFFDNHGFTAFIAFNVCCLCFHVFYLAIFIMSEIHGVFTFGIIGTAQESARSFPT
ncbi:MAG: hypothetical protein M0C28_09030 [Candidatus Moduliflexus flocculans]|nr:hypothetical protein [Candidatus Moduliflexus flocculans]